MKEKKVKFICDSCSKETEYEQEIKNPNNQNHPYNYNEGWIYIYTMNIKLRKDITLEIKDKHFCSEDCLFTFVKNKFDELIKKRILTELK